MFGTYRSSSADRRFYMIVVAQLYGVVQLARSSGRRGLFTIVALLAVVDMFARTCCSASTSTSGPAADTAPGFAVEGSSATRPGGSRR